jgi:hypothetical protein
VEKNDPPITTKIKNSKFNFGSLLFKEKPILDILLDKDKKLFEKSLPKLKKRKKIPVTKIK